MRGPSAGNPGGLGVLLEDHFGSEPRWDRLAAAGVRQGSSVAALHRAIPEFLDRLNTNAGPFVWTKTADQILASIARFAKRTLTAHRGTECFANH